MQRLIRIPYHFQWLIVFFALHGYSEYLGHIRPGSLGLLVLQLSLAAWVLFLLIRKWYGDAHRAALFITVVFFCYLFYGALQDALAGWPLMAALSSTRVFFLIIVLICLITAVVLFFYKKSPFKLTQLFNCLFLIYIAYDIILIISGNGMAIKTKLPVPAVTLQPVADTVKKPDVYLIVLDEYQGSAGLQQYFQYDNSAFESLLQQKGFYVCGKPSGNYGYTVYAMASMLNMRYLQPVDWGSDKKQLYVRLASLINNNQVGACFKTFNYTIRNLSPFRFMNQEPALSFNLLPYDVALISDKTAYSRVVKNLPFGELLDDLHAYPVANWLNKQIDGDNEKLLQAALVRPEINQPVFTYLHLMMPHRPYTYDSTGRLPDWARYRGETGKDALYLQYLVYTNHRIGRFIEQLQQATGGQAVIMLMSDHGYRGARVDANGELVRNTLNAVYLPGRNYSLWHDTVSNVNQFALLFNTLFNQQLPLQKNEWKF